MNVLDFSIKAGWPGSVETWEYLQNMILQAQQAALLGGKNYIVSGCLEGAGAVGDGIVVVNGEILPFIGGPEQPKIIVVDAPVNRAFFGGANNPYYHNRTAVFGDGPDAVLYADFKRANPDNGVLSRLDKVEKMLQPLMGYDDPANPGTTLYGSWLFWGRPAAEIPAGWEAVPDADWKGKVPVVLNADDVDFDEVGKTGGAKTHTLTTPQMPAHNHKQFANGKTNNPITEDTIPTYGDLASNYLIAGTGIPPTLGKSSTVGGDQPHNNLQPFKVVMFIRFVG